MSTGQYDWTLRLGRDHHCQDVRTRGQNDSGREAIVPHKQKSARDAPVELRSDWLAHLTGGVVLYSQQYR
ncbi:hypothetical protein PoB_002044800 [Plakobranchus ocellatus]|uniref:Uncharacterized protein n=1 Tax=Plakobranchus ocellatus TaxID=259542 RepID=A0AAV3ZHC8_9GAST|nr:hypothetical protein PoB_002044800 [Plakobranchus ocellatus]